MKRYRVELVSGNREDGNYRYEVMDMSVIPPRAVCNALFTDAHMIAAAMEALAVQTRVAA